MTDTTVIEKPRSFSRDVWDQFRTHKGAMAGLIVLATLILFVVVGPFIWRIDPTFVEPDASKMIMSRNKPPTWAHPLGTDQLGRDMLARMMAGGKVSLAVGTVAMLISIFIGTFIGVMAGYFKRLDGTLRRMTDPGLGLPLRPPRPGLVLKEGEFVMAAKSIGTPSRRVIMRHILPNVVSPIMVAATLGIAGAIF